MCISRSSVLLFIHQRVSNIDCHERPSDSSHYSQTVHAKNRTLNSQNIYNMRPCHSSYEPLMMDLKAVSKMAIMNCLLTQLTFKEAFIAYTHYKSLNNAMCNCKDQANKNSRTQKMTTSFQIEWLFIWKLWGGTVFIMISIFLPHQYFHLYCRVPRTWSMTPYNLN